MKIGMYAYFSNNRKLGIGKILEIEKDKVTIKFRNHDYTEDRKHIMASSDLSCLLRYNDIITLKNDDAIYRVLSVPNKESACDCFYLIFENNIAEQLGYEDIHVSKKTMQQDLVSVMTSEQFDYYKCQVGE